MNKYEKFLERFKSGANADKFSILTTEEDFIGVSKEIRFRCNDCNFEDVCVANNIISTKRECKNCRRLKNEEAFFESFYKTENANRFIIISDYTKSREKLKVKCKDCDEEQFIDRAERLLNQNRFCCRCKNRTLTPVEIGGDDEMVKSISSIHNKITNIEDIKHEKEVDRVIDHRKSENENIKLYKTLDKIRRENVEAENVVNKINNIDFEWIIRDEVNNILNKLLKDNDMSEIKAHVEAYSTQSSTINNANSLSFKEEIRIDDMNVMTSRSGNEYCHIEFEDSRGNERIGVILTNTYTKYKDIIRAGNIIKVEAVEESSRKVRIEHVELIEEAKKVIYGFTECGLELDITDMYYYLKERNQLAEEDLESYSIAIEESELYQDYVLLDHVYDGILKYHFCFYMSQTEDSTLEEVALRISNNKTKDLLELVNDYNINAIVTLIEDLNTVE